MNYDAEQIYNVLDYETRSRCELKKTGAYEYSKHESTRILCVSWVRGTRAELRAWLASGAPKPKKWSPFFPGEYDDPQELVDDLTDPNVICVAQNALFEQVITRNVLPRYFGGDREDAYVKHLLRAIPPERWICTASLARTLALPGRLEGSSAALGLKVQKDPEGHKLMLKYCKPRKLTKKNRLPFHNDAEDLRRIMLYCDVDVIAEVGVFLALPPLIPKERDLWILDQKINLRGFRVDRELVKIVLKMIEAETSQLNEETVDVTFGELATTMQRDGVLEWLEKEGVTLPTLR